MTVNLKRLKAERIANDLTQDQMAEKMGWSTRTPYAKRENGLVAIGADELAKMATILGYTDEDIGKAAFFHGVVMACNTTQTMLYQYVWRFKPNPSIPIDLKIGVATLAHIRFSVHRVRWGTN